MAINSFYIVIDNISNGFFIFFIIRMELIFIINFDVIFDVGVGVGVGIVGGIPFINDLSDGSLDFFVAVAIIY